MVFLVRGPYYIRADTPPIIHMSTILLYYHVKSEALTSKNYWVMELLSYGINMNLDQSSIIYSHSFGIYEKIFIHVDKDFADYV